MGAVFKYLVIADQPTGTVRSKFTNDKHSKRYIREQTKLGVPIKLFSLKPDGTVDKEIKPKR